jgi:hypothetical protein
MSKPDTHVDLACGALGKLLSGTLDETGRFSFDPDHFLSR